VAVRQKGEQRLLFLLNHNAAPATIALPTGEQYWDHLGGSTVVDTLTLAAYDVRMLTVQG
jgi:hypothetical protein